MPVIVKQNLEVSIAQLKRSTQSRIKSKEYWENQWDPSKKGSNLTCSNMDKIAKGLEEVSEYTLDLGFGAMHGAKAENLGSNVIGIDISMKALQRAKDKFQNPNFIVADITHLPFKDLSIPVVCSFEVLMHMGQDFSMAMDEIMRVSSDLVIVTLKHADAIIEAAKHSKSSAHFTKFKEATIKSNSDLIGFTENDVYSILSKYGISEFGLEVAGGSKGQGVKNLSPLEKGAKEIMLVYFSKIAEPSPIAKKFDELELFND